jgi:hypothetical protein
MINTGRILKDFKKEYPQFGDVKISLLNNVLKHFFKSYMIEVLKGSIMEIDKIGNIEVVKRQRSTLKKIVDHPATSIKRRETGDNSIIVYRTNVKYFSFEWLQSKKLSPNFFFKFKAVWTLERSIPKYEDKFLDFKPYKPYISHKKKYSDEYRIEKFHKN